MQRLRSKYGEYLVAHQKSGIKLSPIAFSEIDAWYLELKRINETPKENYSELDDVELRRVAPHG